MHTKPNAGHTWKCFGQIIFLLCLGLSFSACGVLKELKEALKEGKTTLKTGNSVLAKIDSNNIGPLVKSGGKGLLAAIAEDAPALTKVTDALFEQLGQKLSRELSEIKLKGLDQELNQTLRKVLDNDTLRQSIQTLLSDVLQDIEQRKIKLNVDVAVNDQQLLNLVNGLRDSLLSDQTGAALSGVLNKALLNLAQADGLDSLLTKVGGEISKVDEKLAAQNQSWKRFVNRLWLALASLGLLGIIGIGYFFRKRSQYKRLAALLTKGIDQIGNRQDYDRIVGIINSQADAQQVRSQLKNILKEHQGEYPGKTLHQN